MLAAPPQNNSESEARRSVPVALATAPVRLSGPALVRLDGADPVRLDGADPVRLDGAALVRISDRTLSK